LTGARPTVLLDVALLAWTAAWIWMGITVGQEVRGLTELSDTAARSGAAVAEVGDLVAGLPLIGDEATGAADDVATAGRDAVAAAGGARESARRLGVLLGLSIAVIPISPVLLLYVPARIAMHRERRTLRAALARGRTADLDRLLAERAVTHLPYHRLRRAAHDPGAALRRGEFAALADEELSWHGLARSSSREER
jgi:hypothetical protein